MTKRPLPLLSFGLMVGGAVLLSGCLQISPGSKMEDDGVDWQSAESMTFSTEDFPEGHDWMLIEVLGNRTNPPLLAFNGTWHDHHGPTSELEHGRIHQPSEFRESCLILWWGGKLGTAEYIMGMATFTPDFWISANDDAGQFNQQVNTTTSLLSADLNGLRPESLDEEGRGFYLFGTTMVTNPRPDDSLQWSLASDEGFQWRMNSSGRIHCHEGPETFEQGTFHAVRGRPVSIMEANGLEQNIRFLSGGFLWVQVDGNQGYRAQIENDKGLRHSFTHSIGDLDVERLSEIWWTSGESDWTISVDDFLDINGNPTLAHVALDGLPPHVANLAVFGNPDLPP